MAGDAGSTLTEGNGFTVIVNDDVFEHPLPSVPVTIYKEVLEGLAFTEVPVEDDSPEAGLHA